jgi:thiol:disulfide interchange protein DsbD
MMKKIIFTLLTLVVFLEVKAQIMDPVQWIFTAKKINSKMYELHITAALAPKWHMYAQDAGKGPEPTSFSFTKNPLLAFEGKVKEIGKLEKSFDQNFNSVLRYYADKIDFVQKVKLKSTIPTIVKGAVTYMVCNDRQCLPPKDVPFSIRVGGK